ncbi:2,4-dienoyl-CoA reductase-like NADH-dependent reductase (Old Yellow Enzyme family) [Rhizobium sp. SLBN-94]|nr:2,4-dienoyl-CoA reductase-like NADH-dependent reductase (Old Yellow Enzyme family) [Rhizobium sp. SLBN-94]
MSKLFSSYDLAGLSLSNRVVMAPMTRARTVNNIPDDLTALYYAQRASAGLIISEGAPVSEEGRGYLYTPGLYTDEQRAGWQKVTQAVHEKGGRIFAQLWHVGRISHTSLQPGEKAPVGPTSQRATSATSFAIDEDGSPGQVPASTPRALETDEVARVTNDFVKAARMAIEAGFDGVEIHGANGYIFEQFINGALNDRSDQYGGSIGNRIRFLLETVDAVAEEIGMNLVGVRISPFGRLNDLTAYPDEAETWIALAGELDARRPAYVHLSDQLLLGAKNLPDGFAKSFRKTYRGTLIAAGGFDKQSGERALENEELDLVAIGRGFIANPDLVERMRNDWPLSEVDRETLYGTQGARGYTDYPTRKEQRKAEVA